MCLILFFLILIYFILYMLYMTAILLITNLKQYNVKNHLCENLWDTMCIYICMCVCVKINISYLYIYYIHILIFIVFLVRMHSILIAFYLVFFSLKLHLGLYTLVSYSRRFEDSYGQSISAPVLSAANLS